MGPPLEGLVVVTKQNERPLGGPLMKIIVGVRVEFGFRKAAVERYRRAAAGLDGSACGHDFRLAAEYAQLGRSGFESVQAHAFEFGDCVVELNANPIGFIGLDHFDQGSAFQKLDASVTEFRAGHANGAILTEAQKNGRREQQLHQAHIRAKNLAVFESGKVKLGRLDRLFIGEDAADGELNRPGGSPDHVLSPGGARYCQQHAGDLHSGHTPVDGLYSRLGYNDPGARLKAAWRIAGVFIAAGLLAWSVSAQVSIQPRPRPRSKDPAMPSANLRVDTSLVLVPVTVNTELNQPVTGLERQNFRVYDDKVEQTISTFSREDEPIALGLVFDVSGSMRRVLPEGRQAAAQFLRLANPEHEFFLVEFDSEPRLTIPLTDATGSIHSELLLTKSHGSTALFDALDLAIEEMRHSKKTKKALVLFSDGGENNSRYTQRELDALVKESDVLIYTVLEAGYDADPLLMTHLAEMTGAHMYPAGLELADTALQIAIELRNRYVLGYVPTSREHDGKYHRIEVKVLAPRPLGKVRAHWRTGYNAPSD